MNPIICAYDAMLNAIHKYICILMQSNLNLDKNNNVQNLFAQYEIFVENKSYILRYLKDLFLVKGCSDESLQKLIHEQYCNKCKSEMTKNLNKPTYWKESCDNLKKSLSTELERNETLIEESKKLNTENVKLKKLCEATMHFAETIKTIMNCEETDEPNKESDEL
ncbi:hypothetical protein A3Q56_05596 [Intoshia linei]|uniref:Uncharacterized protein n=1 Tax=Intoshia linei TaxID=1819745 RepID=A0A177AZ03_9BILA|nr:hypothetical protein A3Q56_05596 [Intoshia linei]